MYCVMLLCQAHLFLFLLSWMVSSFVNENGWEWLILYKLVILLTNTGVFVRMHNELYLMGISKKKAVIKIEFNTYILQLIHITI